MRTGWAVAILPMLFASTMLHAEAPPAGFATVGQPAPINALTFPPRDVLPAPLNYLQTAKYIDDGMVYADPLSRFFISPVGEMCFRIRPDYPTIIYNNFYRDWCIYPQFVDRVEAVTNPTINEVRLWCMRAYPQCAHSGGEIGQIANSISVPTVDYRQERAAVENLIRMMGGSARSSQPLR
jgi:hypothetical protein